MRLLTKGLSSGSAIGLLTNGLLVGGLSIPVEEFQYPAGMAYLLPYSIGGEVFLLPYPLFGDVVLLDYPTGGEAWLDR
jgi:hypothetical protein